jgi:hypothetical protein
MNYDFYLLLKCENYDFCILLKCDPELVAGAETSYTGSGQKFRLLAALAPQLGSIYKNQSESGES